MIRTLTVIYSAAAFLIGITTGYVALNTRNASNTQPQSLPTQNAVALNGSNGLRGFHSFLPIKPWPNANTRAAIIAPNVTPLPTWDYNVTAGADLGGGSFSGTMIGRSPFDRGKTTTTIPIQIVPLTITINNGGSDKVVYDPTAVDPCVGSITDTSFVTNSPIFTSNAWSMNGVSQGTTQYIDAFQRAEFNTLVGGTPYHLMLNATVLPAQSLTFGSQGTSGPGSNNAGFGCGSIGVIQIHDLDNAVAALITGPLAGTVNVGTFPIFLTKSVVSTNSGTSLFSNCCILGYHSGFSVGGNFQIYSPFSLDTVGAFGGDVATLSHEMAEAINDPFGDNLTPPWGHIGQVSGCQGNLEVGDPLSGKNISIVSGGQTYHLQEMAFFSWFFGGTSLGSGGKFSSNGTFGGDAKPCPSGGTN